MAIPGSHSDGEKEVGTSAWGVLPHNVLLSGSYASSGLADSLRQKGPVPFLHAHDFFIKVFLTAFLRVGPAFTAI